jgi:hypothetical protein
VNPNQKYQDTLIEKHKAPSHWARNTSILKVNITDVGSRFIKFQVWFSNSSEISAGGIEFKDELNVAILYPFLFAFKDVEVKNKLSGEIISISP